MTPVMMSAHSTTSCQHSSLDNLSKCQHNLTFCTMIYKFLSVIALSQWMFGQTAEALQLEEQLSLSVSQIFSHNATFTWSGLEVTDISSCTYTLGTIGGEEKDVSPYIPKNNTNIQLVGLDPHTTYDLYLTCDTGGKSFDAKLNFTTANEGEIMNLHPTSSSVASESTEPPAVQKEKIRDYLNPADIAIGIVFGAIGLGIVCTVLYYVVRKVRREQRIRRFLQYRQQENDPFPGLEQRDDDGLYI